MGSKHTSQKIDGKIEGHANTTHSNHNNTSTAKMLQRNIKALLNQRQQELWEASVPELNSTETNQFWKNLESRHHNYPQLDLILP